MSGADEEREAQELGSSRLFVVTQVERGAGMETLTRRPTSVQAASVIGCHSLCYDAALLSCISPPRFLLNQKPPRIVHNQFSSDVCVCGKSHGEERRRYHPPQNAPRWSTRVFPSLLPKPPCVLCPVNLTGIMKNSSAAASKSLWEPISAMPHQSLQAWGGPTIPGDLLCSGC